MKLVSKNSEILHYKQEEYFGNCNELRQIVVEMFICMGKNGGIGLAANQVGLKLNLFVMDVNKPIIAINPKILNYSDDKISFFEGCLSYPMMSVDKNRSSTIDVEYKDIDNNIIRETLTGLESICFQHEYDHLQGITIGGYSF